MPNNRALTIKYCSNYNDSLAESAVLVERWTIEHMYTLLGCQDNLTQPLLLC